MNVRNEIKAQIIRAGMTMQEVVDLLSDEYGWSDSVSTCPQNYSGKASDTRSIGTCRCAGIRHRMAAKTGEMPRQHPLASPVPIGALQCCLWMAVKDTVFTAAVCKSRFRKTA